MSDLTKKITIYGRFFDSYIYNNRLLLVSQDRTIDVINWRKIVESIWEDNEVGFRCAFLDSKFLYNPYFDTFYADIEFKNLVKDKIRRIDKEYSFDFESTLIQSSKYNKKKSKLDVLPNDILIYKKQFYHLNYSGLFIHNITSFKSKSRESISASPKYIEILNPVSIFVSNNGTLYLATLENGLWEFNDNDYYFNKHETNIQKVMDDHVSYGDFNYSSIFIGSTLKESVLLTRFYDTDDKEYIIQKRYLLNELFGANKRHYYVSSQDKIYQISDIDIKVIKFDQRKVEKEDPFAKPVSIPLPETIDPHKIVSSSIQLFGLVIEFPNCLMIMKSDNTIDFIGFEDNSLVNIRTFPRSKNFSNQLHLIFENKIEIISFNDDPFVNQNEKLVGIRFNYKDYKRDRMVVN